MTECPNPSHAMRWRGATWSAHCGCPSCVALRSAHAVKIRTALTARQDVDEIAVERAVIGDRPARLNKAERIAAAARLTRNGLTARQIATRLRVTPRTVTRYRKEIAR